ncbi:MAG: hydrolase [Candidatus Saccharibacteria bacterium]|nr:hydrolase [Candidatus Saccharibacteria bacterium]
MRIVRVRAVIPYQDKFLFVQHRHDSSFWALPGGKLDPGETLEDGVTRELIEELGVTPEIGKLLYVQQLFRGDEESLEFFFEITNGEAYIDLDLQNTTHGMLELARAEFIEPANNYVLPEFLRDLTSDFERGEWPKVLVRTASNL